MFWYDRVYCDVVLICTVIINYNVSEWADKLSAQLWVRVLKLEVQDVTSWTGVAWSTETASLNTSTWNIPGDDYWLLTINVTELKPDLAGTSSSPQTSAWLWLVWPLLFVPRCFHRRRRLQKWTGTNHRVKVSSFVFGNWNIRTEAEIFCRVTQDESSSKTRFFCPVKRFFVLCINTFTHRCWSRAPSAPISPQLKICLEVQWHQPSVLPRGSGSGEELTIPRNTRNLKNFQAGM